MSDESIMPQIRFGGSRCEAAVRLFYNRYASAMMRFFMYRGLNADDAHDVFQETTVKIIRSADQYQDRGQENAWFWQIARNCLTDFQRKHHRIQSVEIAVDFLEELPVASEVYQDVDRCVSDGLERYKAAEPDRVYALSLQMNGLSMAEISERIGRTISATKEYLSQCRKKAQPFIAHCYELLGT